MLITLRDPGGIQEKLLPLDVQLCKYLLIICCKYFAGQMKV